MFCGLKYLFVSIVPKEMHAEMVRQNKAALSELPTMYSENETASSG